MRISAALLSLGLALGNAAQAAPMRIVSLNPCLDTTLVAVADRTQIAALSHYARDPYGSNIAEIAATLPITYETAEEVIALGPDLVLASRHSAPATRNALRRLGIEVSLYDVPNAISQSIAQVRQMAKAVGHEDRGEAVIADIEVALAAAKAPDGAPPIPALILQPNGFTIGAGTLSSEMMKHTGFVNTAERYGIGSAGNIQLERLIADPPQVLFAGVPWPNAPGWAERVLHHPAVSTLTEHIQRTELPERLMYCGGPVLIGLAKTFAAARGEFKGAGQ